MNRTILVVEDNDLNLRLFTDVLEAHGYAVLQAQLGRNGLELARARRPDLVVMDIQLPDMSGLDVIRSLKGDDALRAIPVLAVTAFAMKGDKETICGAGSDAYMSKPIEIRRFIAVVRELLGEPAPVAAAPRSVFRHLPTHR